MKQLFIGNTKNKIMKQVSLLLLATIFSFGAAKAQGEMDAYKFSKNDLTGTARSVSMGGAFGALGGDISGVAINPAGIGVYKNSEIVTTLNFQNTNTQTNLNAGKIDDSKFKFNFNNLAFVSIFPLNSDVAPSLNVGFSYNRLKNFDRKYSMRGVNQTGSIADYMAQRATNANVSNPNDLWFGDKNYNPFYDSNYDWMAIFGYSSRLITPVSGSRNAYERNSALRNAAIDNDLYVYERGGIDTYDFNIGTTFSDIISWGMTLSLTDINYKMSSRYSEDFFQANKSGGFDFFNELKTEGTGIQVSTGIIVKPINELRLGVAYHSPTWYKMTDTYEAYMDYNFTQLMPKVDDNRGEVFTDLNYFDYDFRTPDKWTFSMAGVIGQTAIISADYELTNYQNMKLFRDGGGNLKDDPNPYIKRNFRMSSTLRVGAEVRVTPQFSLRAGYSWVQSPLVKEFKDNKREVMTVGTTSDYVLDGDTNYFTYGLGYRFTKSFYTDIAFLMKNQKSDLYSYYGAQKATLKTDTFQGMMTVGYRF